MVQGGAMNEVALSCSSKATGRPQALSRRNTLQVVAVASRPLSGMMSCLAPSPAVMSSLATTDDQIGAVDAEDFLGLSLGDERAERKGFGVSGRWGVHGLILCFNRKKPERIVLRHPII